MLPAVSILDQLNERARILNGNILGSVFIDGNLTGSKYLELLKTHISEKVAQVDCDGFTTVAGPTITDLLRRFSYTPPFLNRMIEINEELIAWRIPAITFLETLSSPTSITTKLPFANCCARITHSQLKEVQKKFIGHLRYLVTADGDLFEYLA